MTLKDLRIIKGLNQRECAEYLGMTIRNYQNYENDESKSNTARYHAIYQQLENYSPSYLMFSKTTELFHTNVTIKEPLRLLTKRVLEYKKRDCFKYIEDYLKKENNTRVCILYGLRRTGKTTLLFQTINTLPLNQSAYIKIKKTDNMSLLIKDLEQLCRMGYKYIFIDEITLMEDFIKTAAILSDIFASMGLKIFLSGTDSLGFSLAKKDELYDRTWMIHTSFISFKEYSHLLGLDSVDSYIEYGGTLKIENMSFKDEDSKEEEVSFRDDESTRKYIDTAISRNIQHSLKNDENGRSFYHLQELYDAGELTNVINRLVESMNHQFLLSVVSNPFKSHDFGSSKELLLHEYPQESSHILYDVNEKEIVKRLKKLIDVIEQQNAIVLVKDTHIKEIKEYLMELDLIEKMTEYTQSHGQREFFVFSQSGMRYSIAKALVFSLLKDPYFAKQKRETQNYISSKILEDVKGRMLEDLVLLERKKTLPKGCFVFKYSFDDGGEYDMVEYDETTNTCKIYEIKHSDKVHPNQVRHLKDEAKILLISQRIAPVNGRYVLYKGETKDIDGIHYLNVEEYLKSL